MTAVAIKADEAMFNPLDIAEMVIMDREWVFDRPADGELIAEVGGTWCTYRLWFNWQEDSGGLALSCALESKLPKYALAKVYPLLALVNEKLWLGHFDICSEDHAVTFRHSLLLRDGAGTNAEHLQELIDVAVEECERFYPAFQSVVWGGKSPEEALVLSIFETVAEA
ncbi:MAG: YbjN domain-containing protein [Pseudomonadota bacterium]|nr:YbjN domain-containing protein [Pseudomonadota bacterium]MDE3037399.1 YbjN domain-containing protein [Pseudomonadota bacterium]